MLCHYASVRTDRGLCLQFTNERGSISRSSYRYLKDLFGGVMRQVASACIMRSARNGYEETRPRRLQGFLNHRSRCPSTKATGGFSHQDPWWRLTSRGDARTILASPHADINCQTLSLQDNGIYTNHIILKHASMLRQARTCPCGITCRQLRPRQTQFPSKGWFA